MSQSAVILREALRELARAVEAEHLDLAVATQRDFRDVMVALDAWDGAKNSYGDTFHADRISRRHSLALTSALVEARRLLAEPESEGP